MRKYSFFFRTTTCGFLSIFTIAHFLFYAKQKREREKANFHSENSDFSSQWWKILREFASFSLKNTKNSPYSENVRESHRSHAHHIIHPLDFTIRVPVIQWNALYKKFLVSSFYFLSNATVVFTCVVKDACDKVNNFNKMKKKKCFSDI